MDVLSSPGGQLTWPGSQYVFPPKSETAGSALRGASTTQTPVRSFVVCYTPISMDLLRISAGTMNRMISAGISTMDRHHQIRKIVDRLPYARRAEAIRRLLEKPSLIGRVMVQPLRAYWAARRRL